MPTDIEARIEARVSEFVAELSALVREAALDSVTAALGGSGAPRRGPGRPRSTGRALSTRGRAKGEKRSPAELEALTSQLLSAIKKSPGLRIEQLATAIDVPSKELALPTRKLLADGSVRKKGQKRATSYFAK